MTQYAIVTDLNKCVGCLACSVSCKVVNNVPIGSFWNKVLRVGPNPSTPGADFPNVDLYFLPVQCQHCAEPECVKVCPTGASHKMDDGTVQVDKEKCIGCQFCAMSCPYNVRYLNEDERVVEKCTLCEQKIAQGELPQCVAQCGGRARFFGDAEKGIDSFEAPDIAPGNEDRSYEALQKYRITLKESIDKGYSRPYQTGDIHTLPDAGNGPSLTYILRDMTWQGKE